MKSKIPIFLTAKFWTAISAVIAAIALVIAMCHLASVNKTSRADFVYKFTNDFSNTNTQTLIMLFDCNLLKFEIKKPDYPYFRLDESLLEKTIEIDDKDKNNLKQIYSAYEIDNYLLGYFNEIGNYEKTRLLDFKMVDDEFGWYIERIWENLEIKKYIEWTREQEKDQNVYGWFDYIYNKCKTKRDHQKALKK